MGPKDPEPHSPDPRAASGESGHWDALGPSPFMGGGPDCETRRIRDFLQILLCDFRLAYVCLFFLIVLAMVDFLFFFFNYFSTTTQPGLQFEV